MRENSAWRSVTPITPRVSSTLKVWGQDATWLMNTTEKMMNELLEKMARAFHVGHVEIIARMLLLALHIHVAV